MFGPFGSRAPPPPAVGGGVTLVSARAPARFDAPDGAADVVVACWSAFRGAPEDELTEAARLLRPNGRLLIVHDYGRDDVAALRGDLPEYGAWSRRGGPFLRAGFKIRVVHCWWTFTSQESTTAFLTEVFGDHGRALAERLSRPRLSYNVAIYHRTFGEAAS